MHGYTQRKANDRYLLVDQESESFGYKRMIYNLGYNRSIKGFVKEHGMPDFIYEYSAGGMKDAIRMYYVDKNEVYIYEQSSWTADSIYVKEVRELTESEKQTYNELLKN